MTRRTAFAGAGLSWLRDSVPVEVTRACLLGRAAMKICAGGSAPSF
jgi:hypothetical protein